MPWGGLAVRRPYQLWTKQAEMGTEVLGSLSHHLHLELPSPRFDTAAAALNNPDTTKRMS